MNIKYRQAKHCEYNYIAKMVTDSFKDYPLFYYTFFHFFKSEKDYLSFLETLFRVYIKSYAKPSKCIVGISDNKIISISIIVSPKDREINSLDYFNLDCLKLILKIGYSNIQNALKVSDKIYSPCAENYPDDWYIELIAVDNALKGQNLGSKMLDYLKKYVISQNGSSIKLLTSLEKNRKFYTKNGFQEFNSSQITINKKSLSSWYYHIKL